MRWFFVPIGFILINILVLDFVLFFRSDLFREQKASQSGNKTEEAFHVVNVSTPSGATSKSGIVDSCSPFSCVDLIKQATASSNIKSPTTTPKTPSSSIATAPKEYYVTLGSGQTTSDEWEDVAGTSVYIDSTKYGKIKKVTFEASLAVPTANGRVYAQLFNDTDKHPIWFSEVSMEGNSSTLLISTPITLDPGNKLYKVQMKTTLQFLSILDQARVHIITE